MSTVHSALAVFGVAVMILAPTLLFLALWRGLMWIRDDDLVNRALNQASGSPPKQVGVQQLVFEPEDGPGPDDAPSVTGPVVRCGACGTVNVAHADYCRHCLEEL